MPRLRLAALILFLLVATCVAQAAPTVIPHPLLPPTLDGRLDDWPALPQIVIADAADWHPAAPESAHYRGPDDISAEVRLAWDNQNLYLALETRDDNLVRVRSASEIDHGDSVVLAFATEGAEELDQFVVALLKGSSLVWRSDPTPKAGEVKLIGRAIWARANEAGGWQVTYELALPWSELSGLKPFVGGGFVLTVSACDDDGAGLKGCLESSSVIEFSGSPPPAAAPPPPAARPALSPTFPSPEILRYDARRFLLRGQEIILFGGAVDYARLPKEVWASRLQLLRAAGMNTVGVTVPWAIHQPTPAAPDLSSLRDFLSAVAQAGLWAQVNLGPFAGETWEAGGVPGWYHDLDAAARQQAAEAWISALLPVIREQQLPSGGPVISVLVRPLPEADGRDEVASLSRAANLVRAAGLAVPVLTANAPAARDNSRQALANLLDTISFYAPPSPAEVSALVRALAAAENGPALVSALPGSYATPQAARATADAVRIAFANGAAAVIISDFAPGLDGAAARRPGDAPVEGVIPLSGLPTYGYGELALVANFVRLFGPQLARAVPAEGVLRSDERDVPTAARLGEKTGFLFLWNETDRGPRQVRLSYNEPGTSSIISLPAAGAISLPALGAKALPLDVPVGRGALRYTTSEVAALQPVGDRILLVVYGDQDTPGELALRWPGPPLVVGEALRQEWNPDARTLTLDYYHQAQDQHLLIDDLQVVILSRARAAAFASVGEEPSLGLSSGLRVSDISSEGAGESVGAGFSRRLKATLHAPAGDTAVTAVLPGPPSAVLVDGKPVEFRYTTPARVLGFTLTTKSYEQEQQPSTVLDRLSRTVIGGPPRLLTSFDRAQFLAEINAPQTPWTPVGALGRSPEALGLCVGDFARLRTRVDPAGRTTLNLAAPSDPALVFVNRKLVTFAAGEADLTSLLLPGENEFSLLLQLLPRRPGLTGLRGAEKLLPVLTLKGDAGDLVLENWEVSPGLAGEAAGWAGLKSPAEPASLVRLGPWREQGAREESLTGLGWYRLPFTLPKSEAWEIPYQAHLTLTGNAQVYLDGVRLATLLGPGRITLPLPASLLATGSDHLLAVALYDPAGKPALEAVEVSAVKAGMTRRRQLEIRF